jgi:hypothetical protein
MVMSQTDHSSRNGVDAARQRPMNRIERRRQKIADEIARNRRGEYTVPTWVLALTLVVILGAWIGLIVLA